MSLNKFIKRVVGLCQLMDWALKKE
jgi:hypothetical protein